MLPSILPANRINKFDLLRYFDLYYILCIRKNNKLKICNVVCIHRNNASRFSRKTAAGEQVQDPVCKKPLNVESRSFNNCFLWTLFCTCTLVPSVE